MAGRMWRRNRSPPPFSWPRDWSTDRVRFGDRPPIHSSYMNRYRPYNIIEPSSIPKQPRYRPRDNDWDRLGDDRSTDWDRLARIDNDWDRPTRIDNDRDRPARIDDWDRSTDWDRPTRIDNDWDRPTRIDNDRDRPARIDDWDRSTDWDRPTHIDNDWDRPTRIDNDRDTRIKYKKPIKPRIDPPTSSRIAYGPWSHASDTTVLGTTNHAVDTGCGSHAHAHPKEKYISMMLPTGKKPQLEEPIELALPFTEPPPQPQNDDKDFSSDHDIDAEGEFSGVLSRSLEYKEMCRGRGLYCHWCDLGMTNIEKYQQHLLGARHKKMLRKKGLEDEIGTPSQARINTGLIGDDDLKIMLCIVCKEECYSNKLAPHVTQSKHLIAENNWRKMNKRLPRFIDMFVERGKVPSSAPTSANKQLYCSTCQITLTSYEELEIHNAGKKHCRLVAASNQPKSSLLHCKLCDIQCANEADFQVHLTGNKHAMLMLNAGQSDPIEDNVSVAYSCDVCNVKCTSVEQLKNHFMQEEHFRNVSSSGNEGASSTTSIPHDVLTIVPGYGGYNSPITATNTTTTTTPSYHNNNPALSSWQAVP